ncbi:Maf family nucleotide pyrophosphatase [Gardnerella greenwoodii]|uniref:Nucleoside triphosphate pyrophosphatase n=1 Tax=Gardnerella greenwoodii 00703Dmash TaxID=698960 RepID=I4MBZ0_9BIFI|nr:Maf family nucleotide pyrophosphatase [Gardnerella greenwoodii]EIK86730.1 Maf-like/NUDIX hydrolase fusion protein [Gardnerella greenwoodii 00703Dmash]
MAVTLILASKSPARRAVLAAAGVIPVIHESEVDEPAALRYAASERGTNVEELSAEQRVSILACAKAKAVYESWKRVADSAASASGDLVVGYPLEAEAETAGSESSEIGESSSNALASDSQADVTHNVDTAQTRDFSGVTVPTKTFDIHDFAYTNKSSNDCSGVLIVGCDSMFLLDGECYGKPHTPEIAFERIKNMSGKTGQLWTGHCLIDAKTGKFVCKTSHASVTFSQMSDAEIRAYVETGEPLEVAGSFTLEGFGGAFIEGIQGDPHGVLGISLPLLRNMVAELGYAWPDLWNKNTLEEVGAKNDPTSTEVPKENVHQPGDGWVQCNCGRRHWGHNGAAGVLLARRDEATGRVTHVVMQHRALWSAEGGTWGIPGGAISDGESAIEGALRESFEEANITSEDIEVVGAYREDHGNWCYTTVFAFEKLGHSVDPCAHDDESMEIKWVPIDDVPKLKLLTAMRTDWPSFRARLDALAAQR